MEKGCKLCPHECGVNRCKAFGRCRASDKIMIGGSGLHKFEEPCISGENGSGTVFFSKCNLNCVFCQNYEISNLGKRKGDNRRGVSRCIYKASVGRCREYKFSFTNNLRR